MAERRYTLSEITAAMGDARLSLTREEMAHNSLLRKFIDATTNQLKALPPVDRDAALDKIAEILSPND